MQNEFFEIKKEIRLQILEKIKKRQITMRKRKELQKVRCRSMLKNIIELENKIKAERIELAKTYVINNGMDPKLMTEDDLFAIYSCLIVKAQKRMNENLDKLIDSMV